MEEEVDNEIRIADKEIKLYLGQEIIGFQRHENLTLSAGETFTDKALTIANISDAIAIEIDKEYRNLLGRIKWKSDEIPVLNKRTGKSEKKLFYRLGIKRTLPFSEDRDFTEIDDLFDVEDLEVFENSYNPKDDEIKLGDKDIRLYLGEILVMLQKFDKLNLSFSKDQLEKVKYLVKMYYGLGVKIDKDYINQKKDKIRVNRRVVEIINKFNGRREKRVFYVLRIKKIPELYMYTDPERAIELPPLVD